MTDIPESTEEPSEWTVAILNDVLQQFERVKNSRLHASSFALESKIPFDASILRAVLTARMQDTIAAILLLIGSKHMVPAIVLVRSALEVLAIVHRFEHTSKRFLEDGDEEQYHSWISSCLFGTKREGDKIQAINVNTMIGHMEKAQQGAKLLYDDLSEITHPNRDGVIARYAHFDKETYVCHIEKKNLDLDIEFTIDTVGKLMRLYAEAFDSLADLIKAINDKYETRESAIFVADGIDAVQAEIKDK